MEEQPFKEHKGNRKRMVSRCPITVTKYMRKSAFREEMLIFPQSSRDLSPRLPGLVTCGSVTIQYIMADIYIGKAALLISSINHGEIVKDEVSIISLTGIINLTSPSYLTSTFSIS